MEALVEALKAHCKLAVICNVAVGAGLGRATEQLLELLNRGRFEPNASKDRQLYALVCVWAKNKKKNGSGGIVEAWWTVFFELLIAGWIRYQLDPNIKWPSLRVTIRELELLRKTDPGLSSIVDR